MLTSSTPNTTSAEPCFQDDVVVTCGEVPVGMDEAYGILKTGGGGGGNGLGAGEWK